MPTDREIERAMEELQLLKGFGFRSPSSRLPISLFASRKKGGTLYEGFLEDFEDAIDEEEEEKVVSKYVEKLKHRGGWKEKEARNRLLQILRRRREGGFD